jgi:hypothetical protein
MYDEVKGRLQERISAVPRFSIEHVGTGGTDGERAMSLFSAYVASELGRHISRMRDDAGISEAPTQPHAVPKFGGLRTRRQLENHLVERLSADMNSPIRTRDFVVPTGSRVLGPPYDLDWSEGNGVGGFSRFDGKALTIPKANGFSAAGIGFYLTTQEPALAAITPQGTYDWNWTSFQDLPFARSRGGMGVTVYANAEAQPTLSRQPVLWSVSGMTAFSGQMGSGRIADAASPAFGLGAVPLAPVILNMVAGSRYLVWVWCWQTSQLEADDVFIAFMRFIMPFITIEAGPPMSIR